MKTTVSLAIILSVAAVSMLLGYIFSIFINPNGSQYDAYTPFRIMNGLIANNAVVRGRRPAVMMEDKEQWFPDYLEFERGYHEMREEILELTRDYELREFRDFDIFNSYLLRPSDKWRVMPVMLLGQYVNIQYAPKTIAILKKCCPHSGIRNALVSLIEPRTNIAPHEGNFMSVVRYHLCLYNPEPAKSYLNINDTIIHWEEGRSFMFDDMYTHSVVNYAHHPRIVIYLDLVRYNLPWYLKMADHLLHYVATFSGRYSDYVAGSRPTLKTTN
jgi:aspartyl/asparaginyl beta-hydroxylase (cupin superfamily)